MISVGRQGRSREIASGKIYDNIDYRRCGTAILRSLGTKESSTKSEVVKDRKSDGLDYWTDSDVIVNAPDNSENWIDIDNPINQLWCVEVVEVNMGELRKLEEDVCPLKASKSRPSVLINEYKGGAHERVR